MCCITNIRILTDSSLKAATYQFPDQFNFCPAASVLYRA